MGKGKRNRSGLGATIRPVVPVSKPNGLTRRRLFKWGLGLGITAAVSGFGIPKYLEHRAREREKRTVRYKIENHPDVKNKEVFWYKPGKGRLREMATGTNSNVNVGDPLPGDRSSLHTHPEVATNNIALAHLHRFLGSNPSPLDVRTGLSVATKHPSTRTAHVAVLDSHAKVLGYYSFRFSKELLARPDLVKRVMVGISRHDAIFSNLMKQGAKHPDRDLFEPQLLANMAYLEYLKSCKKIDGVRGIIIHKIPMPGHRYHQGSFV